MTKVNWTRISVVIGVLGGGWMLVTAMRDEGDRRYILRAEYDSTMVRLDGKLDRILDAVCESDAKRVCR